MTVEITDIIIDGKIIKIEAIDVSEENFQRIQGKIVREQFERTLSFEFDTTDIKTRTYIQKWLHKQKITAGCRTVKDACFEIINAQIVSYQWKAKTFIGSFDLQEDS